MVLLTGSLVGSTFSDKMSPLLKVTVEYVYVNDVLAALMFTVTDCKLVAGA